MSNFEDDQLSDDMAMAMYCLYEDTIGALNTFEAKASVGDSEETGTSLCYGAHAILRAIIDFPSHKTAKEKEDWEIFLAEALQDLVYEN